MADLIRNLFQSSSSGSLAGSSKSIRPVRKPIEVTPDIAPSAVIKVFGIGGGGCNALNRMISANLEGVEFYALNTDAQANYHSHVANKITLGNTITKGLGAGSNPEWGKKAAEENEQEIREALEGSDMIFITCGMGGGTGTGASPVVADIANEMGILTVAIITLPFSFEGKKRMEQAIEGIEHLRGKVDSIIEIPNDRVLQIIDKKTPLTEAFQVVDEVLQQGIRGISDLITVHGLINVDFADVRSVMQNSGRSLMGIGYGTGENRAGEAARAAVESPLLEFTVQGAKGVIINITGGSDLSMFEIDEAARIITDAADPDANIIFGAVLNDNYTGEMKCSVIATGFDEQQIKRTEHAAGQMFRRLGGTSQANTTSATGGSSTSVKNEEELEVPAFLRKSIPSGAKSSTTSSDSSAIKSDDTGKLSM